MGHNNQSENNELYALIDDVVARYQYTSNDDQPRIRELLQAEKELQKAKVILAAWEIFRNGISEQYPELLKWCPQNTITIHDPELPGVVIFDSVNL
jgi:hypothetical protein